jgi:hypothetical protein
LSGDRYIVRLSAPAEEVAQRADEIASSVGGDVAFRFSRVFSGFVMAVPDEATLNALEARSDVVAVHKTVRGRFGGTQSNPQWALDRIDQRNLPLNNSFTYHQTGAGAHLYIIDSGIRGDLAEFSARLDSTVSMSFVYPFDPFFDCFGHGTPVASLAGGTTYGVAKQATIYSLQVGDCNGSSDDGDAIAAIDHILTYGDSPGIINISIYYDPSWALDTAVQAAIQQGFSVVVIAGNGDDDACDYSPARVAAAITVGASTDDDERWFGSNWGTCVDLFAPGDFVRAASADGGYDEYSGTSMSSPMVAGVVALARASGSGLYPTIAQKLIKESATSGVLGDIGTGSPNLLLYSHHNWVRLLGPGAVINEGNYTWTADAWGGDGSYAYDWQIDLGSGWANLPGTSSSYTRFLDHTHPSFQLRVSATSNGETVSAVRSISVLIECEDRNC